MSLEKHIMDIVKQLHDEIRMGDKRAEQWWNLIRAITTEGPEFAGLTLTEPLILTGDGKVIRHIRVGGGSWYLGVAPPAPGFWSVFPTLDFDTSADEEVHYVLMVPYDWDGTTDIGFVVDWAHEVEASTAGVAWALEYRSIEPGEGIGGVTVTLVEPSGATVQDVMQRTVFSPCIAASDLTPGDTIGLRLYRDVSDAGDTLAGDASLINTHFHVTVDKLGLAV